MRYPEFFHPFAQAPHLGGSLYATREEDVAAQARAWRDTHSLTSADQDEHRVLVLPIDVQVGFCMDPDTVATNLPWPPKGGALFVPGAPQDTTRACRFILDNLAQITSIAPSMDTHQVFQIFHADFWAQIQSGTPPPPFTVMGPANDSKVQGTHPDGSTAAYRATRSPELAAAYPAALADAGAAPLTIWPYHCRLGSTHHALMPILSEVQLFHSIARDTPARFDLKGQRPLTESYGVVGDEIAELQGVSVGERSRPGYIQALLEYDQIVVFGQALSHCVKATVDQIAAAFSAIDPALVQRITVLSDCCSPVSPIPGFEEDPESPLNFPAVGRKALVRWAQMGIQVQASTEALRAP
ncbi:MAG: nicotinamidase-related amidase [Cognaticolwellia sp.]|jgi:nicotinamidase-related amidase